MSKETSLADCDVSKSVQGQSGLQCHHKSSFYCTTGTMPGTMPGLVAAYKTHTTGTMPGLVAAYKHTIKTLTVQTCRRFARKTRDYIRGYMDGVSEDQIDQVVSTTYKSHRYISLYRMTDSNRVCRRVFDSSLQLVIAAHRTLSALEEFKRRKTATMHARRAFRQDKVRRYKIKMESLIRQRADSPQRAHVKRQVIEQNWRWGI